MSVPSTLPALAFADAETCEEHLGNALQVVRGLKQSGGKLDLETFAAIHARIEQARKALVARNV